MENTSSGWSICWYKYWGIQEIENKDVILVDTIGHLSSLYQYGDIGFIGGGFGKGLHNTLEAATFGLPVFFGPNHKKFREALELIEVKAAFPVTNYKYFSSQMDKLLSDANALKKLSAVAENYVKENTGATRTIIDNTLR